MSESHLPDADVTLDAREIDGGPFGDIMDALGSLGPDEQLLLVNGFEPEPLYDVLEENGFAFEATERDGEWHVLISHAD